jgi:PAS domain S-box-containing protein
MAKRQSLSKSTKSRSGPPKDRTACDATGKKRSSRRAIERSGHRGQDDQYRALVELSPDAVLVHRAGIVVFLNAACLSLFGGADPSDIIGKTVLSFVHPDWRDAVMERLRLSYEDCTPAPLLEMKAQRVDGTSIDVEVSTAPITFRGKPAAMAILRVITARKEQAVELQRNRALLQAIIDGTSDAVYVKDRDGRYLMMNREAERITGRTKQEVVGRDDLFLFPDEEARDIRDRDRAVMDGGMSRTFEETVTASSGQQRTYLTIKGPLIDDRGGVTGIFGIARDITERKSLENELRHAASFPAANPSPVLEFDAGGTVLFCNAAAVKVLHDLGCDNDPTRFLPGDARDILGLLRSSQTGALPLQREVTIEDRVFLESLHLAPEFGTLRIYAHDITERKRSEDALRIKDRAIEASMNGIAFADMTGRLTYVNDAFLSLWGYTLHGEVIGRSVTEFWKSPNDAEQIVRELERQDRWQGELLALRKDGSEFPAEISASFVRDNQGNPICMMGAFSDITDRKQAAEMLQRSHDDLVHQVRKGTVELEEARREIADLLEEMNDSFFALDPAGRFRYLNGQATKLFGQEASALLGKRPWEAMPQLAGTIYQEEFERSSREQTPVIFESPFPGRSIWVEVRTYVAPESLSVFVHEISERKEMERYLQVTADLLKLYAQATSKEGYLDAAVEVLKAWCGCSHLGIRLSDGRGNIPFASCTGYSEQFLSTERSLSLHDDCVCTRIVRGVPQPQEQSLLTPSGSFVCNDLALFLDTLKERTANRYRGACLVQGFRSLAVVPVRYREQTLGAIHIADERAGVVQHRMVETLDQAALIIGEALFRFGIEEDLRRNYDALGESEERYRLLVQDVPDIIFTLTRDGMITSLNPAFERTFGWKAEAWLGKHFGGLVHPTDLPEAERQFERAVAGGHLPLFALRVVTSGGEHRSMEFMISSHRQADGGILGIARDITERLRTEEEHNRLVTAVESSADAVVITEPEQGRITYVNRAFEQMTGYAKQEVLGRTRHFLESGLHPDEFFRGVAKTIRRAGVWRGLLRNRRKDGSRYDEECSISPVMDASGRISSYIYVKRDVTEKLRLEHLAESVSMMDNIGSVFAGVRHEIGNPINAINMVLGILLSKLDDLSNEKVRDYLRRMLEQVDRVEYILRSLKNFNLFETQVPQHVQVTTFMRNFLPLLRVDYDRRGITLDVDIAPEADWMYVDARALQQVLMNVLTNATDALADRPDPSVAISVRREDDRVRIEVRDSGSGISPERLRDIFRPFYTTKKEGTGLGLVIVQKMLAKMNGSIEIRSSSGEGTTAVVTVPAEGPERAKHGMQTGRPEA